MARPADDGEADAIAGQRDALIEAVITESEDDGLLDRYLGGEEVGFDTVVDDLETAVARGAFHPVLACVPTTGLGVPNCSRSSAGASRCPSSTCCRRSTPRPVRPENRCPAVVNGPLVAEVVKTTTDPYVGRVSVVRVFSGALLPDVPVHVSGHFARFSGHPEDETWHAEHDLDERAGAISRPLGATLEPIAQRAVAGDIVAVARLAHAETGDTLSDPADPAVLSPWSMPEPLLPVAISARSSSEEDKLVQGLARLQAEDPTVRVAGQPGDRADADVDHGRAATRGAARSAAHPRRHRGGGRAGPGRGPGDGAGRPRTAWAGTSSSPAGTVSTRSPRSRSNRCRRAADSSSSTGWSAARCPGSSSRAWRRASATSSRRGVNGHPMVDLRVTLVGGKAHSVDSSDAAFQMAGSLALKEASHAAGVQLLEPMDSVTITVDDEYVGAVLADLASRRGRVRGTEPVATGRSSVCAEVPEVELTRYAVDLRSLAHGTGAFSREYLRHVAGTRARAGAADGGRPG